jgi:hypothetical protein
MPAVRGFLSLFLSATFLCVTVRADASEDAARALAKIVAARLGPNETGHVTSRNLSSLGRPDASRIQAAFELAIRKRVRNPVQVEIALTISENVRGFLLVAELKRGEEQVVEMQSFQRQPTPAPLRPAMTLSKKLLWEQGAPILDIAPVGPKMLVLSPDGAIAYQLVEGKWTQGETLTLHPATPASRDPRGRLSVDGDSVAAEFPGMKCSGTWTSGQTRLTCDSGGIYGSRRNTSQAEPQLFSEARVGQVRIAAETDGRTRVFDANGKVLQTINDWGSDLAAIDTCAGPRVATSGATDREATDTVTLYELGQGTPVRSTAPMEFPGPVTALWPTAGGAIVVARNLSTHAYEAYVLTADCVH